MVTFAVWGILQLGPAIVAGSDFRFVTVRHAVIAQSHAHWAWLVGLFFVFYRLPSIHLSGRNKIHRIDWERFEVLVAEVYRRNGYQVEARRKKGADGGVDFRARKRGKRYIVQCKRWNKRVGVPVVREMAGVLAAEHQSTGVIIVTNNQFTREAIAFADGKPIELVNGDKLQQMMGSCR
ncbi:hypothetical protein AB833_09780 [Chromatiales bacterium (ex Bugula neritina AB1)]|nr:hypothetical protein AB833_09780 [Chromatiales bacterium (ex Bugula neritina AB1)]